MRAVVVLSSTGPWYWLTAGPSRDWLSLERPPVVSRCDCGFEIFTLMIMGKSLVTFVYLGSCVIFVLHLFLLFCQPC